MKAISVNESGIEMACGINGKQSGVKMKRNESENDENEMKNEKRRK
jgi:hypothetical protein